MNIYWPNVRHHCGGMEIWQIYIIAETHRETHSEREVEKDPGRTPQQQQQQRAATSYYDFWREMRRRTIITFPLIDVNTHNDQFCVPRRAYQASYRLADICWARAEMIERRDSTAASAANCNGSGIAVWGRVEIYFIQIECDIFWTMFYYVFFCMLCPEHQSLVGW